MKILLNIASFGRYWLNCNLGKINHPNTVSIYRKYINGLKTEMFDLTNGFKCGDVHRFEKLKNISINIFELIFCQDQKKCKHKLIPIEVSKNDSDRVVDLLIYKKHYAFNGKLNVFLGDHHKNFICRHRLNSYTSESILKVHEQKSGEDDICSIRTSNESHLYWKKLFQKNP